MLNFASFLNISVQFLISISLYPSILEFVENPGFLFWKNSWSYPNSNFKFKIWRGGGGEYEYIWSAVHRCKFNFEGF